MCTSNKIALFICLFFVSIATLAETKVTYKSTEAQKNAVVRVTAAYSGSDKVVKVTVVRGTFFATRQSNHQLHVVRVHHTSVS